MKPTIITVCYNSEKTIEKTINSVLSQTYTNIEYIVIDGASKDNTLNIINKYSDKISKIISEKDKGMYFALNKGIRLATGDIIGILHSNDIFADKNVIKKIADEIRTKKVDSVYGDCIYVKDNRLIRKYKSPSNAIEGFKKALQPAHTTFFAKKEIYDKYGVFNTKFKIGADFEILARFLGKYKISYSYMPEVIVKMENGGLSNRNIFNIIKNNYEVYKGAKMNGFRFGIWTIIWKLFNKKLNSR